VLSVVLIKRTALGLRLRAVGLNQDAATHAGLTVRTIQWNTFTLSGAAAGLSGALILVGFRYYIAPGWAASWGLLAIVIAFMALRSPLMITVWAIVFGMINASGVAMKGAASVPDSVTTLMQALPVICLFVLLAIPRTGLYRTLKGALSGRGVT
jgi:simple sugar transport system permease protein